MILSACHEDAIDYHDPFTGSPAEFGTWVTQMQAKRWSSQHFIMNRTVGIDGDVAHAETYLWTALRLKENDKMHMSGGRYVDRFERRNGEWKIGVRRRILQWRSLVDAVVVEDAGWAHRGGTRDRSGLSYK